MEDELKIKLKKIDKKLEKLDIIINTLSDILMKVEEKK